MYLVTWYLNLIGYYNVVTFTEEKQALELYKQLFQYPLVFSEIKISKELECL